LEEFGGGLLTARTPAPSFDPNQAHAALSDECVIT
jgi:hypothetical protein